MLPLLTAGFASLLAGDLLGSSPESTRLRNVQKAVRDGMVTSALEDAAIEAIGGEFAATYGEITERGFTTLGQRLNIGPSDHFIDLGSGLGRLCVQAARDFGACAFGVEYAASRHKLALAHLCREAEDNSCIHPDGTLPPYHTSAVNGASVTLIQGDCADAAVWEDHLSCGTVIYASNLLFSRELNVPSTKIEHGSSCGERVCVSRVGSVCMASLSP
mmetsp:Transcript_56197/g.111581  ORF Transcript_56197/g.111581 Transcript_56197/m.111581 type:complete len:217 (-) Transcript_56197:48-698(-)